MKYRREGTLQTDKQVTEVSGWNASEKKRFSLQNFWKSITDNWN